MLYHILLIDDDKDDRDLFLDALSSISNDAELTALESGINLISDLISGTIQIPDIIFLDVNVPGMDGWTCLAQLKTNELFAHIPVVMYSTSSHREEAERSKNAGALSFFSKSYDFKDLKAALKEVIEYLKNDSILELSKQSKRFF